MPWRNINFEKGKKKEQIERMEIKSKEAEHRSNGTKRLCAGTDDVYEKGERRGGRNEVMSYGGRR